MMKSLLAALAVAASLPAQAAVTDCPMRNLKFSVDSPLYDVLLSDAAKAAVEAAKPGAIKSIPPFFAERKTPSFATILTFKTAAKFGGGAKDEDMAKMNAALAGVPVTAADKVARCERYDNDHTMPAITAGQPGKPRVLLFEKMTGFRDGPSVEAAKAAVLAMAKTNGWSIAVTDKGGSINPAILKQFDVVFWNNISGDVLTLAQRKILKSWVERGGGFVAVHGSGGDPIYFWDWYADTLLGARFVGHPMLPQFQDAKITLEPSKSGIGNTLPTSFTMNDEWYSFAKSARLNGGKVIATLDETSYTRKGRFGESLDMGADHPIIWNHCVGAGKSFYSAIGHRPETYSDARYVTILTQAVEWAGAKGKCVVGQ